MLPNKLIGYILDMTPQGVGKWKKEERQIINLLEKYFSKEDLEEFLNIGKITKFELLKDLNEVVSIKIMEFLNIIDDVKFGDKKENDNFKLFTFYIMINYNNNLSSLFVRNFNIFSDCLIEDKFKDDSLIVDIQSDIAFEMIHEYNFTKKYNDLIQYSKKEQFKNFITISFKSEECVLINQAIKFYIFYHLTKDTELDLYNIEDIINKTNTIYNKFEVTNFNIKSITSSKLIDNINLEIKQ